MTEDALKLTVYAGERDHVGRDLLADRLLDLYDSAGVRSSVMLRGIEGFGLKHSVHTERLLTLSEDLPILAIAIDSPEPILELLPAVEALTTHGLVTLERARYAAAAEGSPADAAPLGLLARAAPEEALKLTVFLGRYQRAGGRPASVAVVESLRRHGAWGASVLLGLDGTLAGRRRRARLLAGNEDVPLMVLAIAPAAGLERAIPELQAMLGEHALALERVVVCKREGTFLGSPAQPPGPDASGAAYWQKLVVHCRESARAGGEPLYAALVGRLRREGAAGATVLRGQWGFHGEQSPGGERFFSLTRRAPLLIVLLDTPNSAARSFEIVDELTGETGLVTSELVPALRAAAPHREHGGLRLASPARPPLTGPVTAAERLLGSDRGSRTQPTEEREQ